MEGWITVAVGLSQLAFGFWMGWRVRGYRKQREGAPKLGQK